MAKDKIKALIIDDEPPARSIIRNYLKEYATIEVVAECSNGFEALKEISQHKPQLIFLDIQMPKISGFEMLELLDDPPVIVFSTAYDQYALKAFEANAADYLLKPYSKERFREAMNKAMLFIKEQTKHQDVVNRLIAHRDAQEDLLDRVVVKSGSKISIIAVEKLLWLEAQDDYVMLHTKEGEFLKQKTMKYFESHLDPKNFVRIHRSFIVHVPFIKQIEQTGKESYHVRLANGKTLPVSKTGHTKLKQLLR